jgi:hypothetical protein
MDMPATSEKIWQAIRARSAVAETHNR